MDLLRRTTRHALSNAAQSHPGAQPAENPLSLGVIFLTLYLDLVGFSIIFPLYPEMLTYYLELDGNSGLLAGLLGFLDRLSTAAGTGGHFTPVLFGGVLGSLYAFLQFAFSPFWGALSDRFGRRSILLLTVSGTALSYLIWIFSGNFLLLVLARLCGGLMSGNISVATAAVADVTSRADRAKGMGLIGAAFGLGFVTGPAIGGVFSLVNPLDHFPQLASLGVNPFSGAATVAFLLACLNLFWIWRRFSESLPPERRSTASIASRNPIALLLARHEPPVRRTNHVYFLFIFAFAGMEFTLSFLAVSRFDFSTVQITGMMVYVGLILIITQGLIVRRAAPKVGERRMAITGLALVMAAFVILGLAPSPTLLYVGLTVMGLGSGLTTPSLTALVSLYTNASHQGRVLGTFRSLGSLGRATGPIIASFVFWWFGSNWSYLLGAALLVPSFLTALLLTEPSKSEDGS
ncbi:MAG: MFS transporter [Opitutaceae bacterium]